ncbi:hypothetical protein [Clostridium sp. BJN0001]|uniref:hypothetical protein n=1 Tax=Clostridium sp. BJN0001 TaxID=2930219 RepID=UPI001FD50B4A|nr:hypothetical protein [Clostridium sp. BJN0001]
MIKTIVCKKNGCNGNQFYIHEDDSKLKIVCKECGSKYEYNLTDYDYRILSNCSKCANDTFKVFYDEDKNKIYEKCTKCGEPPEKIFIDDDGIQVSYEAKLLKDVRKILIRQEEKLSSLEMKIENFEKSQQLVEESLAYINKYISEIN